MDDKEFTQKMLDLFSNPLFKMDFLDFLLKTQQEGIEAAKKFWSLYVHENVFPNAVELYERMVDFYIIVGLVPKAKYDRAIKENERLKEESKFLRDTLSQLQENLYSEGGEKAQQAWQEIIDKQLDSHREIAKNFFDLFRLLKVGSP
jgi:regulator of replication initiation timing